MEICGVNENGEVSDCFCVIFLINILEGFVGVLLNVWVNVGVIVNFWFFFIFFVEMEYLAFDVLWYVNNEEFVRSGVFYIVFFVWFMFFRSLLCLFFQFLLMLFVFEEEFVNGVFFVECSIIWANKVYYDYFFVNGDWQLFMELSFDYLFGLDEESYVNDSGFMFVFVFLSYFFSFNFIFYVNVQYVW